MSTPQQIVLMDAFGDELFCGSSAMSDEPPPTRRPTSATLELDLEDDEPCPETLRSSVSSVPRGSGEHVIEVVVVDSTRAA